MRSLAKNVAPDDLSVTLQVHKLALQRDFSDPLDGHRRYCRIGGLKSVLVRGVRGNSAWGRSMRAKQIIQARWKKAKLRTGSGK